MRHWAYWTKYYPILFEEEAEMLEIVSRLWTATGARRNDALGKQKPVPVQSKLEELDTRWVDVDGIKTRYVVTGDGEPVILIHGFGEFLEVWWLNMKTLGEQYRVYALDLPGHGLTDKPDVDYTLSFYIRFIHDFMQTIEITHAHLVGHSIGAALSLGMAIDYPDKVDRLVLVDTVSLSNDISLLYRLCTLPFLGEIIVGPTMKSSLRYGMKRAFYNPDLISDEMVEKNYELMKMPETKRAMLRMIRSNIGLNGPRSVFKLTDKLVQVKSPALFIQGERDSVVQLDDVRNACRLVPDARLKVFSECGHCPYIEKAAEFNEEALKFLDAK